MPADYRSGTWATVGSGERVPFSRRDQNEVGRDAEFAAGITWPARGLERAWREPPVRAGQVIHRRGLGRSDQRFGCFGARCLISEAEGVPCDKIPLHLCGLSRQKSSLWWNIVT